MVRRGNSLLISKKIIVMAKKLPEYNASSLADIAFMLLIFFLVTTTMDVDKGIRRRLPPWSPDAEQENNKIKERNTFMVTINFADRLFVEGKPMDLSQLKDAAKEFLVNRGNLETGPEKVEVDVELIGLYPVAEKAVISLTNDLSATYGAYLEVQNELAAAYNEIRDDLSMQQFGKKFDDVTDEQRKAIKKIYPQKISEAEPKKFGGK